MIQAWPGVPALVRDRYLTVLVANQLARALSPDFHDGVNLVRKTFVDSEVLRTSPRPRLIAEHVAGTLKESLSRHETDDDFERIVADLSARSARFVAAWNEDDPAAGERDAFTFANDVVGPMELGYQQFTIPGHFDLTLVVWRPADEASRAALAELAEVVSGGADA